MEYYAERRSSADENTVLNSMGPFADAYSAYKYAYTENKGVPHETRWKVYGRIAGRSEALPEALNLHESAEMTGYLIEAPVRFGTTVKGPYTTLELAIEAASLGDRELDWKISAVTQRAVTDEERAAKRAERAQKVRATRGRPRVLESTMGRVTVALPISETWNGEAGDNRFLTMTTTAAHELAQALAEWQDARKEETR